jgi:hypothetical protein
VLGKLTGEDETDTGYELASLGCNTLEDVVDERVQDGHGTVGDTSVGVDLLEDCGKRRVSKCWD